VKVFKPSSQVPHISQLLFKHKQSFFQHSCNWKRLDLIKNFYDERGKPMNSCPCCSNQLLRHVRGNEIYWFCRNCWQQMPVMSVSKFNLSPECEEKLSREQKVKTPISISKQESVIGWIGVQNLPKAV
jgi:hypothetical protein